MIPRKTPLARSTKPIARTKPIAKSGKAIRKSPFDNPEFQRLVRIVRKRSRGICEMQIRCGGNPVDGDPHHLEYNEAFVGWQRLIVDEDKLVDCCRPCHLEFERRKREGDAPEELAA